MDGGHIVPGSSPANLTALWAARDLRNVTTVVAADTSHLSVKKAAHLLGLAYREVETDSPGRLDPKHLGDVRKSVVVLTAGSTSNGAIDPLGRPDAPWVHVDAAWAGPLQLSTRWQYLLDGVEDADSVAVSAHK
jgi:L-2,4-diaminobutyrate decarboxylase